MVISRKSKSIFIHIQKTAGASIEDAMKRHDPAAETGIESGRRHLFARDVRNIVDPRTWSAYYRFAFVRNPWDRLVSWYSMCMQNDAPNAFAKHVRDHAPTFADFVVGTTTGIAQRTTYNQLDFLTDEDGVLIVDFVGRFERLAEDWAVVRQRLGLTAELPHANRSAHRGYRDYYTAATRDVVARRFERDIAHFGYEF
jgi:chondroitin 4-sulfotransferase 11